MTTPTCTDAIAGSGDTASAEAVKDDWASEPTAELNDAETIDTVANPNPDGEEQNHVLDDEGINCDDKSTDSLLSSDTKYPIKYGRTYHAYRSGLYHYPNDEREQFRLETAHRGFTRALQGQLYLAPIDKQQTSRVLDIGTGVGSWVIDFADKHSECKVLGRDLSPIQPEWVPPNASFEVDDVEAPWIDKHPYDFIHARDMGTSIHDWPYLTAQSFENLRPGGWVEFQELHNKPYLLEGSLSDDSALVRLARAREDFHEEIGVHPNPAPHIQEWLEEAGFINITQKQYQVPIGTWAKGEWRKEIGDDFSLYFCDGVEAFTLPLIEYRSWTYEEQQLFCVAVRNEIKGGNLYILVDLSVVYAQKPEV